MKPAQYQFHCGPLTDQVLRCPESRGLQENKLSWVRVAKQSPANPLGWSNSQSSNDNSNLPHWQ